VSATPRCKNRDPTPTVSGGEIGARNPAKPQRLFSKGEGDVTEVPKERKLAMDLVNRGKKTPEKEKTPKIKV